MVLPLHCFTPINKSAEGVAAREAVGEDVVMLSSYQTASVEAVHNGSGVVLTASVPADWRTSTYSYYAVPVVKDHRILFGNFLHDLTVVLVLRNKST